jgi:type I restriction enzyme, S subunit
MVKGVQRAATPRLRFPEFRRSTGWEKTTLSSVLSEHKLKSDGISEVHSVSLTKGVVPQIEHLGRSYSAADTSHYSLVKPFDLIYTKSPLAIFKLGIVKLHRSSHNAIVSPLYGVFSPINKYVAELIEAYFDSPSRSIQYLDPLAQKGAKNTIHISNERFLSGEIFLPSDEREQQKVADCLISMDGVIAAQRQRVETLKAHRHGLMQQLFPCEGETVPRLRFPEFADGMEWNVAPLGKLFDTTTGGTPDRAKKEYWGGSIPWVTTSLVDFNVITSAEEFITEAGLENSSAKLFPEGTVLVALYGQGKTRGKVALLGIKATTNQACAAIIPGSDIDPRFIFANLCGRYKEMRALSNGGGQENLSQGLIRELPFRYPQQPGEQSKIVGCLSSLDAQITAESEHLHALKVHKNGLMQHLFPLPEQGL